LNAGQGKLHAFKSYQGREGPTLLTSYSLYDSVRDASKTTKTTGATCPRVIHPERTVATSDCPIEESYKTFGSNRYFSSRTFVKPWKDLESQ